jgi:hypothetical protein
MHPAPSIKELEIRVYIISISKVLKIVASHSIVVVSKKGLY